MIIDLGKTDEEKFVNYVRIQERKKKLNKLFAIIFTVGYILLVFGILNGSMSFEGMGKIGGMLFLGLLMFMVYLIFSVFYSSGIAWGLLLFDKDKAPNLMIDMPRVSTDEIIVAYFSGTEAYLAKGIMIGTGLSVLSWVITLAVGFWLGIINAIVHYPECKRLEQVMKEKYSTKIKKDKKISK